MDVVTAVEQNRGELDGRSWDAGERLGFRFCFVYFGLYCLCGMFQAVIPIPKIEVPDPGTLWPFRQAIFWVAAHLFGAQLPLVYAGSGSGDKTFDWTELFCVLIVALIATAAWSLLDRGRSNYDALHKWFRLYIRFCLAATILLYAFDKFIPLQMPFPALSTLLEPYGNFSPMNVLWSSIGASPAYEIFAGLAELLGAVLLMFPRTVTLGALVCTADMFQVFMLNMTYDIPVKQFSFHLLLMSVFLLAPQMSRFADFLWRDRPVAVKKDELLFKSTRANRIAIIVQLALWIWILGMNAYQARSAWYEYGPGRHKPALYGIWDVEQTAGDASPSLDGGRWRRVIFDYPEAMSAQTSNDTMEYYGAKVDASRTSLTLTRKGDERWRANFSIRRSGANDLNLDGTVNGIKTGMVLKREDETKFLLRSREFHWIQEYPFNR